MSLCGRLAVVTGGASGIGRCVCDALASENATVIVADLNLDAANAVAQSLPGSATHRGALVDVGESKSVDELFAHIKDTEPLPVSIAVNCAAIATLSSLVDTTDEDFDNIIRVNLKGTFLVTRASARAMIASGVANAAIVNVGSLLGRTGFANLAAYTASKGGVVALTKTAAKELGPLGIRCNAVLPSLIQTPMGDQMPEKTRKGFSTFAAMRRIGQPEEVAAAILFLCCPQSSFVTGAALEVTGGYAM
ncbi:estradiol 17-beta-dehydrogenase 8-like isoform X2 [Amblyomma americanum]